MTPISFLASIGEVHVRFALPILLAVLGCGSPITTAPSDGSHISANGEQVTVEGTYHSPGKFGPYIKLGAEQVYLVSDHSASWPDFEGRRVRVTGALDLADAFVPSAPDRAGAPCRLLLTTTPKSVQLLDATK
jgi:hypothetical protein